MTKNNIGNKNDKIPYYKQRTVCQLCNTDYTKSNKNKHLISPKHLKHIT
mgnify:CR=1 FL=1